ncbi:hypothetical protein SSX86_021629 [Deinandra increscens subsp. villosa]|uniref:C2H2-type domain-containing protein n=1 Tax=Deinandra increscens subsp. villosa TaxID=3103831 RepID=A0AAP0GU02_9ASTR
MEEDGSLSKGNRLRNHKNVLKPTNKAIITECWKEDMINGQESFGEFSWPPKSYTCNFCKREFRSAQALGGHMNVHRREKAKLRQINPQKYLSFLHPQSPFLDLNIHQNPNPITNVTTCFSSNMPSFPTMFPPFTYTCSLPFSDPCSFHRLCLSNKAKFEALRSRKSDLVVEKEGVVVVNKSETGSLVEPKFDDLDLELRLGCS